MIGNRENAYKSLKNFESFYLVFGDNQEEKLEEPIDLTPFPITNRLCSIFPEVEYNEVIRFKISFCLPTVSPP
jgi:hypothetical protein